MTCEQFRAWRPRKDISIKYTDEEGGKKVWVKNQQELLEEIQGLVDTYMSRGIKLINRQLYYRLVGKEIIPNATEIYKRICTFLTDARYAGFIDWEAIEDRGRVPSKHNEWDNVRELIKSAIYSYRLPRWIDQEYYLELFCEKQSMESVLKPTADKYHIHFGYNKGYSSASTIYDQAKRVRDKINEGKEVKILYLGDHDSSGLDMVRDIRDRIEEFLTQGDKCVEPRFEVIQLALNLEQIKQYNLPPNPAKIKDPRAKWYINQYGSISWELDALEPEVLTEIAEEGIQRYIDMFKYNKWIILEDEQKKVLKEFGEELMREEG